jgi:hypothetical protein
VESTSSLLFVYLGAGLIGIFFLSHSTHKLIGVARRAHVVVAGSAPEEIGPLWKVFAFAWAVAAIV